MNGFRRLQKRLREEGWYVGWAELCCSTCAWECLPDYFDAQYDKDGYLIREDIDGKTIEYEDLDYSKVLFNHEQDCEDETWYDELSEEEQDEYEYEGEGTMDTYSPEVQDSSSFCFNGSALGIKNFKAILPIIEECGCTVSWNGKGDTRMDISWEL